MKEKEIGLGEALAIASKRSLIVGTHNGRFHSDEMVAIAIIKVALEERIGEEAKIDIVRSRDPEMLNTCDIVVDVGDGKYDHHSSYEAYPNNVPMAACGKVLREFEPNPAIAKRMLSDCLYAVQAQDNGYMDSPYKYNPFMFVPLFNPSCDEVKAFSEGWKKDAAERFFALKMAECAEDEAFGNTLNMVIDVYKRLRTNVRDRFVSIDFLNACPKLADGDIVELPNRFIPWRWWSMVVEGAPHIALYQTDDKWKLVALDGSKFDFANLLKIFLSCSKEEVQSRVPGLLFVSRNALWATFDTKANALKYYESTRGNNSNN